MNEDVQLLEAAERYILGEMDAPEREYFEELRKTNPEVDQLVVEHTIFLQQLNNFGERKSFRALLNETHSNLYEQGESRKQFQN